MNTKSLRLTVWFALITFVAGCDLFGYVDDQAADLNAPYRISGGFAVVPIAFNTDEPPRQILINVPRANYYMIALQLDAKVLPATKTDVGEIVSQLAGTKIELEAITTKGSKRFTQPMLFNLEPNIFTLGRERRPNTYAWLGSNHRDFCNRPYLDGPATLLVKITFPNEAVKSRALTKFSLSPVLLGPEGKSLTIFGDPTQNKDHMAMCQ